VWSLVMAAAACGGGAPQIHFPVDGAKVISTLSAAELQAMCDASLASAKYAFELACINKGLAAKFKAGGTEQACQAAVESCRAELSTAKLSCQLTKPGAVEGCAATVGELEVCMNDSLLLVDELMGKISCASSQADVQSLSTQYGSTPPSCSAVKAKCPKLTGG
jgi:hypothetical protein